MFILIFSSLISSCHFYVFWRATSIPCLRGPRRRKPLIVAGLLLWLLFITGLTYGHSNDNPLSSWLELAGMTWMGCLFLLTSGQLAVEVLTGGGWLFPKLAPPLRGVALLAALLLSGLAIFQGSRAPVVDEFEVNMAKLPAELDGMVVVVMSDLHLGSLHREEWLAARLAQVQELHPDLVLLVGDIFEGHGQPPRDRSVQLLRTLTAPLGVWGVPGNHEFYGGPDTIQALADGGVRLLRNSWAEVRPGLLLAGVEEHTFSRQPEAEAGLLT
ncbi:MAG: metallophosphoesterase, partial [Desulfobulbaceae bacterium]|nr:metallophosphoesterase [Desulfobulbaceae bacterium]